MKLKFTKILFISLAIIVIAMMFSPLMQDAQVGEIVTATDEPIVEEQMTTKLQAQDFESEQEIALWVYNDTRNPSTTKFIEIDDEYYHSGSHSMHFYKDSLLDTSWLYNPYTTYTIKSGTSYEVSLWIKSANSSPSTLVTMAMCTTESFAENNYESGMSTVVNTQETPSGWTNLIFHTTTNIVADSFFIGFMISSGCAELWIDDIQVREYNVDTGKLNENGKTIYDYYPLNLDFHAKDETGKMEWTLASDNSSSTLTQIEDNLATVGKLDVQSGYAYIERRINVLQTGYSYKLFGHYSSTQDATVSVSLYDTRGVNVSNYSTVLTKDREYFELNLNEVESAMYAIISIGYANANNATLILKDVGLKQTATTVQESGWTSQWVWYESTQPATYATRYFRYTFELEDDVVSAPFQISCDDIYTVYINGYNMVDILAEKNSKTYVTNHYNVIESYMIEDFLVKGTNVIAIAGTNGTSSAGLIFDSKATLANGSVVAIETKANDPSLLVTKIDDDDSVLFNTTEMNFSFEGESKVYTCYTPEWAMPDYDIENDESVYWRTCSYLGEPPCSPWGAIDYDYSLYSTNTLEFISIETPKDVVAGDTIQFDATIEISESIENAFAFKVVLWKRNAVASITMLIMNFVGDNSDMLAWPVGEKFEVTCELAIPKYLETGEYQLQLEESYLTLENDFIDQKFLDFKVTGLAGQNEKTVSTLENINGVPTIMINGEPCSPVMYCRPEDERYLPAAEDTLINSGIQLYVTRLNSTAETFWKGYGEYDFSTFDASVFDLMAVNGDARIMLCITMFAPEWWRKLPENQSELVIKSERDRESNEDAGYSDPSQSGGASFSSVKFREESSEALTALLNHIKEQGYYNKLFAFHICAGDTFEWMVYDQNDGLNSAVDYSEASRKGFEIYLRNKYGTRDALRAAWGDYTVSFETATLPTAVECDPNGQGGSIILDPQKDQRIIDFNLYVMDESTNLLLHYSEIIKTMTNDEKLVGAFNGYMWADIGSDCQGKVQSSFNRLLNSEYVDFFASPLGYSERYLGRASTYMPVINSIIAHGKLYIVEFDNRTSTWGSYSDDHEYDSGKGSKVGRTYTTEESALQMRKDLVQALTQGVGIWFFDMVGSWLEDDQFYQVISDIKKEYDYSYTFTNDTNAVQNEVAVIVGEETTALTTFSNVNAVQHLNQYLYRYQRTALHAMGACYDVYSMGDLTDGVVSDEYKVYIFLSPLEITPEESLAIDKIVKKNGHTVVWVYAPGYSNGKALDAANISALTGMDVVAVNSSSTLNIQIADKGFVSSIAGNRYGNSTTGVNPLFYVDDKSATTLGTYCKDAIGKAGLAMKEMDGWTSIYSGAPNLSVELLRCILKQSGVHIYTENSNDVLYQRNNYIGIHSAFAEEKVLKLDGNYAVYDVIKGEWYSMNTNEIRYNHTANDTSLFRLSTPDKYRLTVSSSNGGNISCNSVEELSWGQGLIITLTPDEGYNIGQVLIDGVQYSVENNRVVISNIQDNVDVSITFVKQAIEEEEIDYIYQYTEIDDGNILPVKIFLVVCCLAVIVFVVVKNINKLKEKNNDK